ncbi:hypothetical protein [Planctomyces sp. SH-PL62]|uniref:DUF58 domain-containing protein n=1 Tax=Planctomyces sp. SH-PL62 TaxID=1636152 RepID=UPI00078CDAA3|nr:hypothetical protein [Planctomyces sp. SH-PL62]AMV40991.1 hypothetical protein VT85_26385 [Planctomyces sp. SH-PL62]
MLVIVSDLLTDLDTLYQGLDRLRFGGHEVLIMQILDHDEMDLPFDGPTVFKDLEGDEELFAEPEASGSPTGPRWTNSSRACGRRAEPGATTTPDS